MEKTVLLLVLSGIEIKGERSMVEEWEYLNGVESTTTYWISEPRAGEILDLRWISSDIESDVP